MQVGGTQIVERVGLRRSIGQLALGVGIIVVLPDMEMPPVTKFIDGTGTVVGWIDPGNRGSRNFTPIDGYAKSPAYTASIDAAMGLVPEGWNVGLFIRHDWPQHNAQVWHRNIDASTKNGDSKHPALALCAAALKARGL